jgi:tetratricopeptide (TPR) repeat protein
LANAYRVAEDFPTAEKALGVAASWARRGTGDLSLAARILDFGASLFSDQRCFADAAECLDGVESIYEILGEVYLSARALISRGLFAGRDGQHEKAILLLARGLRRASPGCEPQLELVALQSLALNLVALGDYQAAGALFPRIERLFRRDRGILNSLRLHWLKGRIAVGLGQFGHAESSFQIARLGFRKLDKFADSALVSLDLALLYTRLGRRLEIRRLAEDMITTFRAFRIAREAIASLVLLRKTCDQEGASMDLLRGQIETLSLMLAELERRPAREPRS